MNDPKPLRSPTFIADHIIRSGLYPKKKYNFVILGKAGPTGKTWLRYRLREHGYHAVEITDAIFDLVDYKDDENHLLVDELTGTVTIVLNRRLPACVIRGGKLERKEG